MTEETIRWLRNLSLGQLLISVCQDSSFKRLVECLIVFKAGSLSLRIAFIQTTKVLNNKVRYVNSSWFERSYICMINFLLNCYCSL